MGYRESKGASFSLMSTFPFGATPDELTAGRCPVDRPEGAH